MGVLPPEPATEMGLLKTKQFLKATVSGVEFRRPGLYGNYDVHAEDYIVATFWEAPTIHKELYQNRGLLLHKKPSIFTQETPKTRPLFLEKQPLTQQLMYPFVTPLTLFRDLCFLGNFQRPSSAHPRSIGSSPNCWMTAMAASSSCMLPQIWGICLGPI